jgi:hypothetical protein
MYNKPMWGERRKDAKKEESEEIEKIRWRS